jgi:hypothetical protein
MIKFDKSYVIEKCISVVALLEDVFILPFLSRFARKEGNEITTRKSNFSMN